MRSPVRTVALLTAALLLSDTSCPAQTNVYSMSVQTRWALGSHPFRLGLEGYRRDAAGHDILAGSGRCAVDGTIPNRVKDYTCVMLGPLAFSVPLPPLLVALFAIAIFSAAAFVAVVTRRWLHAHDDEQKSL